MPKFIDKDGVEIEFSMPMTDEIIKMIDDYDGIELKDFFKYHKDCQKEIVFYPFLLNNGKVALTFGNPNRDGKTHEIYSKINGTVYSNFEGYYKSVVLKSLWFNFKEERIAKIEKQIQELNSTEISDESKYRLVFSKIQNGALIELKSEFLDNQNCLKFTSIDEAINHGKKINNKNSELECSIINHRGRIVYYFNSFDEIEIK